MKFMIFNDGCVKEHAMLSYLDKELISLGYIEERDYRQADIIIYSTCSSVKYSIENAGYNLRFLANAKKSEAKLIIVGCLTRDFNIEKLTNIDTNREDIKIISDYNFSEAIKNYLLNEDSKYNLKQQLEQRTTFNYQNNVFIRLEMEDGCFNHCTFCKYNYKNMPVISVPFHDTLTYLKELIQNGIKVINLGGENLALYGIDLYKKHFLHKFIHELSLVPGLEKINLLEITVANMYPELLEEICHNPKVAKISMQLESASNKVLALMKRNHTIEDFYDIVKKLREHGKFVTTILMSAFPEETYTDLDYTANFVKDNVIYVNRICQYVDFEYLPSHNLKQFSPREALNHNKYLMNKIAQSNKEILYNTIPKLEQAVIIGQNGKYTYINNGSYTDGYSFTKKFQEYNPGEIVNATPKMLVKNRNISYLYRYRY